MSLGQALKYLNSHTVVRFMITAQQLIPEINLRKGNFDIFDMYDSELQGDVLNREVVSIDCAHDMINFYIE